jgi:hypothetical protein
MTGWDSSGSMQKYCMDYKGEQTNHWMLCNQYFRHHTDWRVKSSGGRCSGFDESDLENM